MTHDWKIGSSAMRSLTKGEARPLRASDLVPNTSQKGVDLRIGLDIVRLSLRRFVDTIVVATGDSDLVPAFRLARREGIRIYLDHMNHNVRRELKADTDAMLDVPINS
ncbi:MAG: NYN domain-containing protein [Salinisphaera sp.]|nr:NYN domain-containing protein [Salinisphaera sp.]